MAETGSYAQPSVKDNNKRNPLLTVFFITKIAYSRCRLGVLKVIYDFNIPHRPPQENSSQKLLTLFID